MAAAAAPVKSTAGSPRPSSLSAESQRLQARCKQLQEMLDKQRQTVSSEREASHLRESRLEAGLAAARKTNVELEVQDTRHLCHGNVGCCGIILVHSFTAEEY